MKTKTKPELKIKVTRENARAAGPYNDTHNCLLCKALRSAGHREVNVFKATAFIGATEYLITKNRAKIRRAYIHPSLAGDRLIRRSFRPFTVTLKPHIL